MSTQWISINDDQEETMAKNYRSEAAKKIKEQQKPKPQSKDSKKFTGGSNPHHGGSMGQSGQPGGKR
jgi:hypothetical protein